MFDALISSSSAASLGMVGAELPLGGVVPSREVERDPVPSLYRRHHFICSEAGVYPQNTMTFLVHKAYSLLSQRLEHAATFSRSAAVICRTGCVILGQVNAMLNRADSAGVTHLADLRPGTLQWLHRAAGHLARRLYFPHKYLFADFAIHHPTGNFILCGEDSLFSGELTLPWCWRLTSAA
jgi:hypothetical protein